jgi:predicted enzyme related to lactoylglutathione lyase
MTQLISHVAINADDVRRSLDFYQAVFGWQFNEWAPGFYRMEGVTHTVGVVALQQRRQLLPDHPTTGFECTVAVDDVARSVALALQNGGRLLSDPVVIHGVGELAWLQDPGGNVLGVMRYSQPY